MSVLREARGGMGLGLASGDRAEFLQTLRDGVVVYDSDQRLILYNSSALSLYGLTEGDLVIGDHVEDVLRMLARKGKLGAPEDEPVEEAVARRLALWRSEESRVERRMMSDGRVLDIYRTPTINNELVTVHVDVTAAVRAEQEIERQRSYLKVLLENVSDGVNLLDRDGRFVVFNDRFPELYGVDPASVAWGIPYGEFVERMGDLVGMSPDEREAAVRARHGFAFDPEVTHVRRKLGDGRTLDIHKKNLRDGGCVMTIRDVTEDLRREQDLLEARNVAEQTVRDKSDFVARMSHDMRAPLNGILGVAALLGRTAVDARQRELLGTISNSGTVLLRLIDDILDLSRLEAEPLKAVVEDIDITKLTEECLAIVEPAAFEKQLYLRTRLPATPVPPLRGDAVRLKQILLNLLINAVKFTDKGHVEMALEAVKGPDGVTLFMQVTDTGVGIAVEKLGRIFDSFYQIDSTATRRYGGAGLGLAISRRLVEEMGGTIDVSSELGIGTVFRVRLTLPLAERGGASSRKP